ncbi:MAG TPA: cupredoxin domain-containing protein [Candidatus Limnocylindrales bacterium]|nr:cupredoxin domain-containing protein [Candidatus Limnocylindrales bacterium]
MSRSVRPALLTVLVVVAAGAVAACGGNPASAGPATAAPAGVVAVEARNDPYSFSPSTLTVPAGSVTFSVKNAGTEEHEFEIFKGETVVDEIEGLVPGLTKELTVTLEAGSYTYVCKLNGHDQLGMKGTLTVQ